MSVKLLSHADMKGFKAMQCHMCILHMMKEKHASSVDFQVQATLDYLGRINRFVD
jgi:hypothetical protein